MQIQDLKYLLSFTIPVSCYLAITMDGVWCWATLIFSFIVIPLCEQLLELNVVNDHINNACEERAHSIYFDLLLYANLPITIVLLILGFDKIMNSDLTTMELTGKLLSMGVLLGASGINVAHELGHKNGFVAQLTAKLLLTPCLYNHFTLQHNRGHHLNVGTMHDPATARKGELLYAFWARSSANAYIQAWLLEADRLKKINTSLFSFKNDMIVNTLLTLLYLAFLYFFFDSRIMVFGILVGVVSFLLLETINYIEHYGLTRQLMPNGKYEKVELFHSWNSDHQLGRIVLYELTRHADHHYMANKKYQTLLHYDQSPQLPFGYPLSMLISAVPPLWFRIMDPILNKVQTSKRDI